MLSIAENEQLILYQATHTHTHARGIKVEDFGMWLLRRLTLEVKTRAYRDFIVQVQTDQLLRSGVKGQRCWEQNI